MHKRIFYILATVLSLFIVAILVYAYGGTNPAVHGHDSGETDLSPITIDSVNSRVGIGTNSPSEKLDIAGNIYLDTGISDTILRLGGSDYEWQVKRDYSDEGKFKVKYLQGSLDALTITRGGNVGIGTTSPSTKLTVYNSGDYIDVLRLEDDNGGCQFDTNEGTPACSSDARLKENIKDAESILDSFMKIKIRNYDWINSSSNNNGVIAQEIMKTHPNKIKIDQNGYYSVDQFNSWELIKAIQELKEENNRLNERLDLLESK